jgi:hypothetical protein
LLKNIAKARGFVNERSSEKVVVKVGYNRVKVAMGLKLGYKDYHSQASLLIHNGTPEISGDTRHDDIPKSTFLRFLLHSLLIINMKVGHQPDTSCEKRR